MTIFSLLLAFYEVMIALPGNDCYQENAFDKPVDRSTGSDYLVAKNT